MTAVIDNSRPPLAAGSRTLGPWLEQVHGEWMQEVLGVMRDLATSGITMVVVTHEMGFAREAGDHLVFMDDGMIVEEGPPREVLAHPAHERTRAFLGQVL